jgi:hypothetical protein
VSQRPADGELPWFVRGSSVVRPWFVFDAGYDSVQLALALSLALAEVRAAILVRLRAGRSFYTDPTTQPATGRPRRHGHKVDCTRPDTWLAPSAEWQVEDARSGHVRVRAWAGLHPADAGARHARDAQAAPAAGPGDAHLGRGRPRSRSPLSRPGRSGSGGTLPRKPPMPPYLIWTWCGERTCAGSTWNIPSAFRRQTLNWTLPRVRSPEQADRWTWLVVLTYTQLRLARVLVADRRLPCERPLTPQRFTPGRVRRGVSCILPLLGSPANPPKPCGRSPGRPKGKRSGRAPRYPAATRARLAAA